MKNPYKVLGVSIGTSIDDCKKAYRKLCRLHHPDSGGSREIFDEVQEAWKMIESGQADVSFLVIKRTGLRHKTLFTFV